jgi:hypothetical protein
LTLTKPTTPSSTLAPGGVVIGGLVDVAEIGAGLVVFEVGGPAAIEVNNAQGW